MGRPRHAPERITAKICIEGPAEELFNLLQNIRFGTRTATLMVETRDRAHRGLDNYELPIIRNGQTQDTRRRLDEIARQTLISRDAEDRLHRLIRDLQGYTR